MSTNPLALPMASPTPWSGRSSRDRAPDSVMGAAQALLHFPTEAPQGEDAEVAAATASSAAAAPAGEGAPLPHEDVRSVSPLGSAAGALLRSWSTQEDSWPRTSFSEAAGGGGGDGGARRKSRSDERPAKRQRFLAKEDGEGGRAPRGRGRLQGGGTTETLAAAAASSVSSAAAALPAKSSGSGRSSQGNTNWKMKRQNKWTPEEDRRLLAGVSKHGVGHWTAILTADTELKRNGTQMHQRYTTLMRKKAKAENVAAEAQYDHATARGGGRAGGAAAARSAKSSGSVPRPPNKWTPEEDRRLLAGVSKHGAGHWTAILTADTLLKRNGKQMQQRYAILMRKETEREAAGRWDNCGSSILFINIVF